MTTRLLVLCRANRCRSPFAAELLRRNLGAAVLVESAGFLPGGHGMPAEGQALAGRLGFDFSAHRSTEFDPSTAQRFDLILTMSRDLSRDTVLAAEAAWPRVFTISQFPQWLHSHDYPGTIPLGEWIDQEASGRSRSELVGVDPGDIPDPMGRSEREWSSMVAALAPPLEIIAAGILARAQ